MTEIQTQLLVVGGGLGGVSAALAAARRGVSVVLTEPTDWLGGVLTSQGVPPDEHVWIEQFGCTATYREFRDAIRSYYRRHYPLTEAARRTMAFNPGSPRSPTSATSRACPSPSSRLSSHRTGRPGASGY
ncbi:FAD-dependent oxidoreductase [Actinomadura rugatobispora]|uniref:FAD-dependent oxidoreductase n=1 Tax=Actinomadura rugatobispora TaxID=1994 RepID=A0ABW1A7L0_9ACTN